MTYSNNTQSAVIAMENSHYGEQEEKPVPCCEECGVAGFTLYKENLTEDNEESLCLSCSVKQLYEDLKLKAGQAASLYQANVINTILLEGLTLDEYIMEYFEEVKTDE